MPANPLPEDQLVALAELACECDGINPGDYVLVGVRKMDRIRSARTDCIEQGYTVPTEAPLGDRDPYVAGCHCGQSVVYFRLIAKDDLSRLVRDLDGCRAKMLIQEIE